VHYHYGRRGEVCCGLKRLCHLSLTYLVLPPPPPLSHRHTHTHRKIWQEKGKRWSCTLGQKSCLPLAVRSLSFSRFGPKLLARPKAIAPTAIAVVAVLWSQLPKCPVLGSANTTGQAKSKSQSPSTRSEAKFWKRRQTNDNRSLAKLN